MDIIKRGTYLTKEAPADRVQADQALELLTTELSGLTTLIENSQKSADERFRALEAAKADVKQIGVLDEAVKQHATAYADIVAKQQSMQATVDHIKKEMGAPLLRGGSDLRDSDIEAGIQCQKRAFEHKGGHPDDFMPDMENLPNPIHYRSAARKLVKLVGIESKRKVVSMFTPEERKAFEAASLDAAVVTGVQTCALPISH